MNKIKAPISLCIIVKNEPLLEKCLKSIRDYVEEIVIVDTGSTDNTPEIAKKYADIFEIYTDCNDPQSGFIEDFSKARQRSFDLATKPYVMWCDADDTIEGCENLNKLVEDMKNDPNNLDAVAYLFPYEYSYNEVGKCTCRHYRERLFSNKNCFHWTNPVHEVLVPNDNIKSGLFPREELVFKHQRQYGTKKPESGRNIRILRKHFEKVGDTDARQMYYLGLECCNVGLVDESIQHLSKYIDVSGWDDERVMACLKLVDIYQSLGQYENGLKWGFKAIEINEHWAESHFAIARMFYFLAAAGGPKEHRNWERCQHFIKIGLTFPPTKTLLFINPMERDCEIYKYLNMAQNKLGNVRGALESVNFGLKKQSDDIGLITNKKLYEVFLAREDAVVATNKLKELGELDQSAVEMIAAILNRQIIVSSATPEISRKIKNDNALDIIFFAGDGWEIWNPETVKKTGIGGSELMLMQQAKGLAALGHKVRVYNSCGNNGIYDGVEYHQTNEFKNLNCDVLIVSRVAPALDEMFGINTKLKLLWVHDVYAVAATNELLLKADRILALSEWHKQNLIAAHNISPEHIIVTRNGIDLNRFENKNIVRNKFKCVNSSSPDRSWPILLDVWAEIKKQVPQAELHLYYGFKNWKFGAQNDSLQMDLIHSLEKKIQDMAPLGVVFHDRINQDQLADEFLSAGCWTHSTWFTETSCISAMEMQAAGCRMVTSNIAALKETAGSRAILLDGEWTSEEYKNKFIENVVKSLNNDDNTDRINLQNYAKEHFGLEALALEWQNMFYSLIEELKVKPMVPYYPTIPYRNIIETISIPVNIKEESMIKLNIGSGPNVFPFNGWINYDREDISHYLNYIATTDRISEMPDHQKILASYLRNNGVKIVDFRVQDLRNGFPQHLDNSIDLIYLGQMIEHINPIYEAPQFIKECFRMLKSNGVIRITTPDLDLLIHAYLNNQMDKFAIEQPDFYKNADPSAQLAYIMYGAAGPKCTWNNYDGHMCLYTQKSMTALLQSAGFKDIIFYYETGKSKNSIMEKEAVDAGMSHSFIVEATK